MLDIYTRISPSDLTLFNFSPESGVLNRSVKDSPADRGHMRNHLVVLREVAKYHGRIIGKMFFQSGPHSSFSLSDIKTGTQVALN